MATIATATRKWQMKDRLGPDAIKDRYEEIGAHLNSDQALEIIRKAFTGASAANNKGLVINQTDTTNNPLAQEIINAGTGKGLFIDQNGVGIALDIDSETTTVDVVNISAAVLTTGKVLDMSDLAAITTGKALHIDATGVTQTDGILVHVDSASTALTATGRLLLVDHTGAASVSGIIAEIASAAADETVIARITASAALALGIALDISLAAMTTGKGIDMSNLDAITTGKALHIDATGVTQTDGILVHIDSASTALTATGRLLLVDHTGNAGVSTIIAEVKSAATDETVVLKATASGAITGDVFQASAAASATGTAILATATAATLTTGAYLRCNDGAVNVFAVGANGHLQSRQTTKPTVAMTAANGISAAAITAGSTDTCGIITTTGTQDNVANSVITVTFNKVYAIAPVVVLFPANAAGGLPNPPYVSSTTTGTFVVTVPKSASAVATPSWYYFVVEMGS